MRNTEQLPNGTEQPNVGGAELSQKIHIGRYMGGLTLFLAGLDEFTSPSGALWAGGRTMVIESYKRIKNT